MGIEGPPGKPEKGLVTCPICRGSGKTKYEICKTCRGTGKVPHS